MAVTVKITETYDMKTTSKKMGLVGIHTPQVTLLRKLYPGLMKNFRYMRFVKCDVVGACASVLPADPLQIGVTSGQIAPEDMFNPILYTAVSNSSYDSLIARIRGLTDLAALGSVADGVIADSTSEDQNFKAYYALLSEHGKYRKAMPQSGFVIKGLVPIAHTVISTFGNVGQIGNAVALSPTGDETTEDIDVPSMDTPISDANWNQGKENEIFYRGKAIKMPRIPLHVGLETGSDIPYPNIPKTHVLALVLPPCKLNEFYYRMRITWTIRFEEVVSTLEAGYFATMLDVGQYGHGTNYTFSESKANLETSEDMVDASDVEINKVMES